MLHCLRRRLIVLPHACRQHQPPCLLLLLLRKQHQLLLQRLWRCNYKPLLLLAQHWLANYNRTGHLHHPQLHLLLLLDRLLCLPLLRLLLHEVLQAADKLHSHQLVLLLLLRLLLHSGRLLLLLLLRLLLHSGRLLLLLDLRFESVKPKQLLLLQQNGLLPALLR
jgi:hypothetical protein